VWFHDDVTGANGSFWQWQVYGLAISSVAAYFSSPTFIVLILLHFSHYGASTTLPSQFSGFICPLSLYICTLTFARYSIPHHPPNVSTPDTTSFQDS